MARVNFSDLEKQIRIKLARESLTEFAKYMLDEWDENFHHEVIYNTLEGSAEHREEDRRVIIQAPPRHGKSQSAGRFLPAFYAGRHPDRHVLYLSFDEPAASKISRDIRRLMASERYKEVFPEVVVGEEDSAMRRVWTQGGSMTFRGAGQGIGGIAANLLILDDIYKNRQDAESETVRNRLYEWYTDEASARLEWPNSIVLMFTRWHHDDLIGRTLQAADGASWKTLTFPAVMDDVENKPDYDPREEGDPLWPGRFGQKEERLRAKTDPEMAATLRERALTFFAQKKEDNPYGFESVYQQRPSPREGSLFKRDWFKTYTASPASVLSVCEEVILSVDATQGKSSRSDKVAMLVVGRRGANLFVIDELNKRMDLPETLTALAQMHRKYPQAKILIEKKANGEAIMDTIRSSVPNVLSFEPNKYGSKEARAQVAATRAESGQIWIPEAKFTPWIEEWLLDFTGFGSRPHDDRVDALSQVCIYWQTSRSAVEGLSRVLGYKIGEKRDSRFLSFDAPRFNF